MRALLLGANDTTAQLRDFLERRGCQCSVANSLDESFSIFGPRSFDLILNTLTSRKLESLCELGTPNSELKVLSNALTAHVKCHFTWTVRLFSAWRWLRLGAYSDSTCVL